MTIIVALKDEENKRVILGADKQATCGQIIHKAKSKMISLPLKIEDKYGKVIKKTKIHIGLCGYAFMKTLLKYGITVPNMRDDEEFITYLYHKLFPQIREEITENKLVKVKDGMLLSETGMILVFDGEIYLIGSNLCVDVLDNEFFVDGSGWQVATGSLYTNLNYHKNMSKKKMVKQAIVAAGKNTIYCDTDVEIKEIHY